MTRRSSSALLFAATLAASLCLAPCASAQRLNVKPSTKGPTSSAAAAGKTGGSEEQKTTRPRNTRPSASTENLDAQNPFAARANRAARLAEPDASAAQSSAAPKKEPTSEPTPASAPSKSAASPTITPRRTQSASEVVTDVVTLRDGTRVEGTLEELSGGAGATISVGGEARTYPPTEIESVEAAVSPAFADALDAFAAGRRTGSASEYRRALALLREARSSATRRIEKELATARITETLEALGRQEEAVSEFFILCRLDPNTAYLSSIPLRWLNQRSPRVSASARQDAETTAAEWLPARENPTGSPNPVGRLLAASTLLRSGKYGTEAVAALRELSVTEAPEGASEGEAEICRVVSLLALAQLWRDETLKVPREADVRRWARTVDLLPNEYRPGPAALVGFGEKALHNDAEAARRFVFAAALAHDQTLAATCMKEAAEAYERAGDGATASALRAASERAAAATQGPN